MKTEQNEHTEFWTKLIHRLEETQNDLNNLSPATRQRVQSEGQAVLRACTLADAIAMIQCFSQQ